MEGVASRCRAGLPHTLGLVLTAFPHWDKHSASICWDQGPAVLELDLCPPGFLFVSRRTFVPPYHLPKPLFSQPLLIC